MITGQSATPTGGPATTAPAAHARAWWLVGYPPVQVHLYVGSPIQRHRQVATFESALGESLDSCWLVYKLADNASTARRGHATVES